MPELHVVVVRDRWDETISFIYGPFDSIEIAQRERDKLLEKIQGDYRQASIQRVWPLGTFPAWEAKY